jgi:hypothetical protein
MRNQGNSAVAEPQNESLIIPNSSALDYLGLPLRSTGVPWIETLVAFLAYFFAEAVIQRLTGASKSSFGLYPDEPSHYISSLLLRDYLLSGFHESPVAFAVKYYTALPYFAVGYWPPAFYAIGGMWMLLFGVQRANALALTAVVAALLAATVFRVLRRHVSSAAVAGLWALLVLLVPQVIKSSSMYMLDLPVALFSLWALLEEIRYCKASDQPRHAIGFALCAALTFLTKYSGGFVFAFPFVGVIATRNWRLLRKRWFWSQFLVSGALCVPWVLFTRRLIAVGLPPDALSTHTGLLYAFVAFQQGLLGTLGLTITLAAACAVMFRLWRATLNAEMLMYGAAPLCLIAFLLLTPVDAEHRYFLPAIAPVVLLIACALPNVGTRRMKLARAAIPLFLCAAGIVNCERNLPHYASDQLQPLVQYVNGNPQWRAASILLPSGCEGAAVAEFAEDEQHRPSQVLLRPSKILAGADWWGIRRLRFASVSDLRQEFLNKPIDLMVLNRGESCAHTALDGLISATMKRFPGDWKRVAALSSPSTGRDSAIWDVYQSSMQSYRSNNAAYSDRTLSRFHRWHALR